MESVVNTKQSNQKTHDDKHVKQRHFSKRSTRDGQGLYSQEMDTRRNVNTTGPLSYSIQIENGRILRHQGRKCDILSTLLNSLTLKFCL